MRGAGEVGFAVFNRVPIATNQGFKNVVITDLTRAVPEYVALALTKLVPTMQAWATGGTFSEISKSKFCELQIPLPPPEVQRRIVAEIAGYEMEIERMRDGIEKEEMKIQAALSRLWGDEPSVVDEA